MPARSRLARRKRAVTKRRTMRAKVRHHNRRRYAGVKGKSTVKARTALAAKRKAPTRKRPVNYVVKKKKQTTKSGQGLQPINLSTYMSMF